MMMITCIACLRTEVGAEAPIRSNGDGILAKTSTVGRLRSTSSGSIILSFFSNNSYIYMMMIDGY